MTHCTKVKIILHFKIKVIFVRADGLKEFGDVVGVQSAGLSGHPAGKVRIANMSNALNEKAYCHKSQSPTLTSSLGQFSLTAEARFTEYISL